MSRDGTQLDQWQIENQMLAPQGGYQSFAAPLGPNPEWGQVGASNGSAGVGAGTRTAGGLTSTPQPASTGAGGAYSPSDPRYQPLFDALNNNQEIGTLVQSLGLDFNKWAGIRDWGSLGLDRFPVAGSAYSPAQRDAIQNAFVDMGWASPASTSPTTTTPTNSSPPSPSIVGGGSWMNGGDQSLGGLLSGAQQASSAALPGLLNQPTQKGLLGGSDFYGSIPWGMSPQDIRSIMQSQLTRSLAQQPNKTTG